MRIALLALVAVLGMEKRNQRAAEQLQAARDAYQSALAKTGDFDCAAPEFDEVLKMFDAVPAATPSKREARDIARQIREKRKAGAQHARALDAAPVPRPIVDADPSPPPGGADAGSCKAAHKRMLVLAAARKKSGRPAVGTIAFAPSG